MQKVAVGQASPAEIAKDAATVQHADVGTAVIAKFGRGGTHAGNSERDLHTHVLREMPMDLEPFELEVPFRNPKKPGVSWAKLGLQLPHETIACFYLHNLTVFR